MKSLRWMVLALAFLLGLAGLSSAQSPTVIRHWVWLDNPDDPTFGELVEEFNRQHPDIRVEWELVPWGQFQSRLLTAVVTGAAPDTSSFKLWWEGQFVAMGALEPLNDYIARWPGRDDVYDSLWETLTGRDGTIYQLPWEMVILYMYYRPDLFAEVGADIPDDKEAFLEVAKKLTRDTTGDGRIDQYGYGMRGARGGHEAWGSFVFSEGVQLFDADGNVALNTPAAVAANDWYADLYRVHGVTPPTAPADGFQEIVGAFEAGTTAMTVHHIKSANQMVAKWGDNVSAMPVPRGSVTRWTGFGDTQNVMYASSRNKEAAFKWISWLAEHEQVKRWAHGAGVVPILKSVAALPEFQENRFQVASSQLAPYAGVFPGVPQMAEWVESLWPATFQQVLMGEISSEEAIARLAKALE